MHRFSALDPLLLNPSNVASVFQATLDAHGTYTTEHFVLRLSPRAHELVDAITRGQTDGYEKSELIQAYSTYLHETLHWWQHVGSTSGLILSLAYPAQIYGSVSFLQAFAKGAGSHKPIKDWAYKAMLNGKTHMDPILASANIAVNNALDITFYKELALFPPTVLKLEQTPYFESVGHSYLKTYGEVVFAIRGSCDLEQNQFPDPAEWDPQFLKLQQEKCEGFYHGSRPPFADIGLHAIFEGQARFSQIQFLASSGAPEHLQHYRDQGYFASPYVDAFETFLRLTNSEWPTRYDSPIVGLFLLICDVAINPTSGFPMEVTSFEDFICDVDPGARFTRLCLAAAETPELLYQIKCFSSSEYDYVSCKLTERCGYDDPKSALDKVVKLFGDKGPVDTLMEEHRTYNYTAINMPIRVMVSHYLAFSRDKRRRPEFFCWPGMWLGLANSTSEVRSLFGSHLSIFQDNANTEQIFPRAMPGREESSVKNFVNTFFGSMLVFDLTLQWILEPGAFKYDFKWLTGKKDNTELIKIAKKQFKAVYGFSPDDCTQSAEKSFTVS
ncbi:hypothetical protein ACWGMK_00760 [Agrobacterium deltaense]